MEEFNTYLRYLGSKYKVLYLKFNVPTLTATPTSVPESSATCTYYASHKVVKIEIMGRTIIQDASVELSHYDVSINGMKTNVSARSENPMASGLFYPVENMPDTAQIVAVDVCGQQSDQTMIACMRSADSTTGGSLHHS